MPPINACRHDRRHSQDRYKAVMSARPVNPFLKQVLELTREKAKETLPGVNDIKLGQN